MSKMKNKINSIKSRLTAHLAGDGTPNDNTTDELYREAHGIAVDAETVLETVERWAFSIFENSAGAKAAEIRADHARIPGDFDMAGPRYEVETAYACNDLARARKGSQDIIGYDVRDRLTGIVEVPCDTEEEAKTEAAALNQQKP